MSNDPTNVLGMAIITTYVAGMPGQKVTFDGFRTMRIVVAGETVDEFPFVGTTVEEQQESVTLLAASMQSGADEVVNNMDNIFLSVTGGESYVSADEVLTAVFDTTSQLLYDTTLVFDASAEATVEECLLTEIAEAGVELAAFCAL
jgi:hypothetical protein